MTVYGGVTAYAAGSHFVNGQLTVVGDDPDYVGRSRRLVGLLVDRDFGIGAWQPLWLLLVPAVAALLARRPRGTAALLVPLAAGWFVATFLALTMQGWWFPGRQLVVVLPLAAIAIAWWVRAGGARLVAAVALGVVGVVAQVFIVTEGLLGRIAWVVNLQTTADPLYRAIRWVTPDYLTEDAATWPLHWAWTVALAAAEPCGVAARAGGGRGSEREDEPRRLTRVGGDRAAAPPAAPSERRGASPNRRASVSAGVASAITPLAWSVTKPISANGSRASPARTVSGPPVWLTHVTPAAASWAISLTVLSRGPSTCPYTPPSRTARPAAAAPATRPARTLLPKGSS